MSQQINLFNPIFLKQKRYFSVVTMAQALGLIAIGAALFYAYANYQVQQMAKQTQLMTARYESEQKRFLSYASEFSPQRANQALSEELIALESQATEQDHVLGALKNGAIGNTKGYSEFMRAFARQAVTGLWLKGFEITGDGTQGMMLKGGVVNPQLLPVFIQRLSREEMMRGKSFSILEMKQPVNTDSQLSAPTYIDFSIRSTIAVTEEAK